MFTMFYLLLLFMHSLYNLFFTIQMCCLVILQKCSELWHGKIQKTDVDLLVQSISTMDKLPKHLVIVCARREKFIFECIKLIVWCLTIGIPYISFYDRNVNGTIIKREFCKQRPDLIDYVSWSQFTTLPMQNGVTGKYKPKIQVLFLSYLDGKNKIVSITQSLAEAISRRHITPEEINTDLLNEKLHCNGIPDPDLALVCGDINSTNGLLPWHIRTTEFLFPPLYASLRLKEFICLLKKYSRSEQRYGK